MALRMSTTPWRSPFAHWMRRLPRWKEPSQTCVVMAGWSPSVRAASATKGFIVLPGG